MDRAWAHSGIRPRSTSESGPVGSSRSPSDAQNGRLSVFGVYSVYRGRGGGFRGLEGPNDSSLHGRTESVHLGSKKGGVTVLAIGD